ncbi:MAG: hypothetical protein MUF07_02235 [Steroidobacteraceae bacterium]|jgi:hypothetical protein|nr:hypothetical protein [Steroidobacteraceae bacterium]
MSPGAGARDRPLPPAVHLALQDGQLIEAVRLLREQSGSDLASAKARIDREIAADPLLRERFAGQRRRNRRKLVVAVLVVDALLAIALLWWLAR